MIDWRPVVAVPDRDELIGGLPPFPEPPPPHAVRTARELPVLVGLAVLIAFVFKAFVAQAFFIPSGSMIPELEIGDRVVVSKVSYRLHGPRRGDIVVFDCPPRASCPPPVRAASPPVRALRSLLEAIGVRQPSTEEYIKRVIGLPGDTVDIRDGRVYIDGRELVEPYLPAGTITTPPVEAAGYPKLPLVVPDGQLWVMGDNRTNSSDSRVFGTIRRSAIVGRAVVRAWPPGRLGYM